jgi:hypothetical protein
MTPTDRFFGWDNLMRKLEIEAHFKEMTANVPGLKFPSVLSISESEQRVVIERAVGINLIIRKGISQGSCVDFFQIPPEMKLQGVMTYLRAIDAINQQNYALIDHKPDSVFIDPVSGVVTIVDADVMSQEKTPLDAFKHELNGGLGDILKSFFTRSLTKDLEDMEFTVPAGVQRMLNKIDQYRSAGEMVRDLEAYIDGKDVFYSGRNGEEIKNHFRLLAREFNDIKTLRLVRKTDFSKVSPIKDDLMMSTIYTRKIASDEGLQHIGKALGS